MSLRKARLVAASLMLALFVFAFLGTGPAAGITRKILLHVQLSPNATRFGAGLLVVLFLIALTMVFGRVYCSLLCPAGLVQEAFHRVGGLLRIRRLRYARRRWRRLLLAVVGVSIVFGGVGLANFLDPAGLFGRLATVSRADASDTALAALWGLGIVFLVLVPLVLGRWFCDRLCPVGALLGLAASATRRGDAALNTKRCGSCGRCEKACPVRAVNAKEKRIDRDRCVLCLDCAAQCPTGAISFGNACAAKAAPTTESLPSPIDAPAGGAAPDAAPMAASTASAATAATGVSEGGAASEGRRSFMRAAAGTAAGGIFVLARPLAPELVLSSWRPPEIAPPGSGGDDPHRERCVSCQSCVPSCPVGIIRMKSNELRPVIDYDRGYCQYDCVRCSRACPAGALRPITPEEKQRTRVARTHFEPDRCVVISRGQACGACAEVCPTHAARMIEGFPGEPTIPDFDEAYCIGCGACYHVCPSEPRAFTLRGLYAHETTPGVRPGGHASPKAPSPSPAADGDGDVLTDFPF